MTVLGARQWAGTLAAALDDVTGRIDVVSRRLADAWPDADGEEWVHRLRVLRTALERDADAAVEFGHAVDRLTGPVADGPRLGGTDAFRVDDRHGVTIPRLNGVFGP